MNPFLFFLTWCMTATISAQEVSFKIQASSIAQLGETIPVLATARFSPGATLAFDAEKSSTDSWKITGVVGKDVQEENGAQTQTFVLDIMPLAVGKLTIPLYWSLKSGEKTSAIQSPDVSLEVAEPPLSPQAEIHDIKAPMAARGALWPWLAALALLALAYYLIRRYSRGGLPTLLPETEPADDRPPHVRAENELDSLQSSGLWEEHRYKEFYFLLTDILRRYVDGRFKIPAPNLTTPELARQMREAEIDRRAALQVKEILDRSDLVKFAKMTPDKNDGPDDIKLAHEIIKETTPREQSQAAKI